MDRVLPLPLLDQADQQVLHCLHFAKLDLSVIDSPVTPRTPATPADITISSGSVAEEQISFSQCQELAKAVQGCSKSLIEGTWSDIPDVRGRLVKFIPADFESAKAFLRNSVQVAPERKLLRSVSDTPVTSRTVHSSDMVCHGCHGPMGQGQHQGSAIGKNLCSFDHSYLCKGGIKADESWKACPPTYIYNPQYNLVSDTGFEHTLQPTDFCPPSSLQPGPVFSTPAFSSEAGQDQFGHQHNTIVSAPENVAPPSDDGSHGLDLRRGDLDRLRRQANGEGVRERIPGMVRLHGELDGGGEHPNGVRGLPQPTFRNVSENIQNQIDAHRANNQAQNMMSDRPYGGLNITHLRAQPDLQVEAEENVDRFRQRIPSLISAQSAPAPGIGNPSQGVYSYNSAQLHRVTGDGIRVSGEDVGMTGVGQQLPPRSSHQPTVPGRPQGQQQSSGRVSVISRVANQPQTDFQSHIQPDVTHCYEWVTDSTGKKILVRTPISQQLVPPIAGTRHSNHQSVPQHTGYQPGTQRQQSLYQPPGLQPYQPHPQYSPPQYQWSGQQSYRDQFHTAGTGQHGQPSAYRRVTPPVTHRTEYRCSPTTGRMWQVKIPIDSSPMAGAQPLIHRQEADHVTYRTEYRCSPTSGEQWQVQVPVSSSPPQSPATSSYRLEWRIHPHTGEKYQVKVLTARDDFAPVQDLQQSRQQQHEGGGATRQEQTVFGQSQAQQLHQSFQQSYVQHQQLPNQSQDQQVQAKIAGIVNLFEKGSTKKQPRVIDQAKKCPAKWAKQANTFNLNLPLYAWSVTSELEASLSGRSAPMQDGELLGKLRHLKNTMEVCCLNSSASDFTSYGWTIAKDYALKVEDEVEEKLVSWQDMQAGVRTGTLVLAQMDFPRPIQKISSSVVDKSKSEIKDVCTTYNKCTTEGKCDYELANPEKTCLRKHECSWCKTKLKQSCKHQVWRCRRKEASGSN